MAKKECEKIHEQLENDFGDDSDAACLLYDKLLVHYAEMMASKEEEKKGHANALHVVQQLTGRYASQVGWEDIYVLVEWKLTSILGGLPS